MYVGHAALALFAKSRRPRLALALLVPVAFAPDWIQWILDAFGWTRPALSHALLTVTVGAVVVAVVYRVLVRRQAATGDAIVLWLVYMSHWAADFLTGTTKATWPGGPHVGLGLYGHPAWDFLLEMTLAVICWLAYRRSLTADARTRAVGWMMPAGLALMQIGFLALARMGG